MMEFVINCIQTGAYSAVFAVMLVYVVKTTSKREQYYRAFITDLCDGLKDLSIANEKLDKILAHAENAASKKQKKKDNAKLLEVEADAQPICSG